MKKLSVAVAICCALAAGHSNAEVRINGFASIVGGKTLDNDKTLYGYDDEISFKNESLFALQLTADLQENLSATAQIVARGNNDFDAQFEWAYLTYEFTDELQLSAGKLRVPFYRYSDFLDVGYTYRWVRPPQSVYNLSFSTYEGLSLLHNTQLGDWDSTFQAIYGSFEGDVVAITYQDQAKLKDVLGVNWTLTYDWFSARIAYLMTEASITLNPIDPKNDIDDQNAFALNQLEQALRNNGLTTHADNIAIDEDDGTFFGIGFSIDYNNILFDTEYTHFEVENSILAKQTQYYVSFGYRMDNVIIHFTYEDNDDKHDSSRFDQLQAIPPLNATVNAALNAVKAQSNVYTIGTRYDFHPSAAFKIDFSRFKNDINNTETDVVSVGVDLVF